MSRCGGLHCDGCGRGGGIGLVLIVVLIVIAFAAKVGKTVARGADIAGHILAVVLEVVLIGLAVLAAAAVAAILGWIGVKVYRWRAGRRPEIQSYAATLKAEVIPLSRPAIEAPQPHLTGVEELVSSPRHTSPIIR